VTSDQQLTRQRYHGTNAAKMGEWHTASHVERQKKAKKTEAPAAPKPNP
jgi:hypothetical protein